MRSKVEKPTTENEIRELALEKKKQTENELLQGIIFVCILSGVRKQEEDEEDDGGGGDDDSVCVQSVALQHFVAFKSGEVVFGASQERKRKKKNSRKEDEREEKRGDVRGMCAVLWWWF